MGAERRLQEQLDEITANTRALVPVERMRPMEALIAGLREAGMAERALQAGAAAPSFALTGATGKRVRSSDLLALGPVVVKFFRGRWCPYDMTELEAWQRLGPELRARGALFVAISPQLPRQNAFTASHHNRPDGFGFPILGDPGCSVAERFGLAYTVPEATRPYFRSILVNIPLLHGDDLWRLPVPGVFVVRAEREADGAPRLGTEGEVVGTVAFAGVEVDPRVRVEPERVLQALRRIQRGG